MSMCHQPSRTYLRAKSRRKPVMTREPSSDRLFTTPSFEYKLLLPVLIVLGGALIGVLVEAFVPRAPRRPLQMLLALGGLVASFLALVLVTRNEDGRD